MKQIKRDYSGSPFGYLIRITPQGIVDPLPKEDEDSYVEWLDENGYTFSGCEYCEHDVMVAYNPAVTYDAHLKNRNDCAAHIKSTVKRNTIHILYTEEMPQHIYGDIYIDAWNEPLTRDAVNKMLDDLEEFLSIFD